MVVSPIPSLVITEPPATILQPKLGNIRILQNQGFLAWTMLFSSLIEMLDAGNNSETLLSKRNGAFHKAPFRKATSDRIGAA